MRSQAAHDLKKAEQSKRIMERCGPDRARQAGRGRPRLKTAPVLGIVKAPVTSRLKTAYFPAANHRSPAALMLTLESERANRFASGSRPR
jgi:hypothetical protein